MKKLAIYYGWPSLVRSSAADKSGTLDESISRFLNFDVVVIGAGLESSDHPDHAKSMQIVQSLNENNKETYGYIHLAESGNYQRFSENELETLLERWKESGVHGVLFDLMSPVYHASIPRVERIVKYAHGIGLGIIYNTSFDSNWLEERVMPYAKPIDRILIEPFGTSWKKESYSHHKKLSHDLKALQREGVKITGVSTYNSNQISTAAIKDIDVMLSRFLYYRKKAEALGFDAYQFTNGEYSACGNDQNVLVDFDSLVT